jgi:hypothetical protein
MKTLHGFTSVDLFEGVARSPWGKAPPGQIGVAQINSCLHLTLRRIVAKSLHLIDG